MNDSIKTIDRLSTLVDTGAVNLTIHVGDIGYADDFDVGILEPSSGSSYESVYDFFQASVEPIAAHVPYMVAPGNHDVTCKAVSDSGCPKQQRNFSLFGNALSCPPHHLAR